MFSRFACLLCLTAAAYAGPQVTSTVTTKKESEIFKPFTGKLTANKVRVRAKPELDSPIIRQMSKNDLLLVIGEKGDFYAVAPTKESKAYVFRSYILDDVVEANHVNVRLEPHVDSPIIGQLQAGDRVYGTISSLNHKWLEITPPNGTHFFVSKEYVSHAGGPEFLANMEKRKSQVEEMLTSAFHTAEAQCKKPYEEMDPQQAIDQFQTITRNFTDFPEAITQAKEGLALLKETYLNKKIAFLESKAQLSPEVKEELLAKHQAESQEFFTDGSKVDPSLWSKRTAKSEHLTFWDTLEESLYLSWTAFHTGKNIDDYYCEQKANATVLTGTIEPYTFDVKNKPGDIHLRDSENSPVAYIYSTQVDLDQYEGKTVSLLVAPRPNNHFAFPAYYVFGVE